MLASAPYDGAIGLLVAVIGVALFVTTLIVSALEAMVMVLLKWGRFGISLLSSILINIISTVFGFFLLDPAEERKYIYLAIAFVLTVVIEGSILSLIKRDSVRQNLYVSLIINLASYSFVILPLWVLIGSS